ncbi:MAG: helix-turn-helix transcriptional regulator [Spirochaetales bacterium]|nr:helix-turn-helix transcriptional regulator [Spirochaetales bacterium]
MTTIKELIGKEQLLKRGITQNELSKVTGVSNTYINYLRNEKIMSPGREKIIAIGAGLNYSLEEINQVLKDYRFQEIYEDDFEIFFNIARSRKITGFQPFYENINYGLLLYTLESIPGDKYLINKKPSSTLEPPEYISFRDKLRARDKLNPVHSELKRLLAVERRKLLVLLLEKYKVTYIVCKHCFEEYAARIKRNEPERTYVIKHLNELINFIGHRNYNFYLIEQCPRLRFTLKYCKDTEAAFDKNNLIIYGYGGHIYSKPVTGINERDRLLGIATDSTKLFEHFAFEKDDYLENYVVSSLTDKKNMISYIEKTISLNMKS